jgi:nucleotide-binding universal stress UspA family protein
MYKVIVVGTDGSDTAASAVKHAADLAKISGATLHIVHCFSVPSAMGAAGYDAGAAALIAGLPEAAEAQARETLERASSIASHSGVRAETRLDTGDPANALITAAETLQADLIVVGNKGMSGVRRFVLGSVPNKVSHHSPCSLLIVNTTG